MMLVSDCAPPSPGDLNREAHFYFNKSGVRSSVMGTGWVGGVEIYDPMNGGRRVNLHGDLEASAKLPLLPPSADGP